MVTFAPAAPPPAQLAPMGGRARRQLPGFRFEFQPPPPADVLPRMDVAAFVGFAASGPLHTPVPVEDPRRFAEIFGGNAAQGADAAGDLPLAWDAERGVWTNGQLGPAVRGFLRNGGQRCWVVRVADAAQAETSRFPVPGVLRGIVQADGSIDVQPASAWARSPGSWADGLQVGAGLTVQGVAVTALSSDADAGQVTLRSASPVAAGDVLRLLFAADGVAGYVAVAEASLVARPSSPPGGVAYAARGPAVWWRALRPEDLAVETPAVATASWWGPHAAMITAETSDLALHDDGTLDFRLPADGGYPTAGSLVQLRTAAPEIWLLVDRVQDDAAGDAGEVLVSGRGMARLAAAPDGALPDRSERLRLELTAALGNRDPWRLGDLDFGPASDRYWGALPSDAELYDPDPENGGPGAERRARSATLWRAAAEPRFPLAGTLAGEAGADFTFPFVPLTGGFPPFSSRGDGAARARHTDRPAWERDGLGRLWSGLFLDPDLAGNLTTDLLNHANDIRYISPNARRLRGIHALLAISEVTLVAVPDATQRPWTPGSTPTPEPPSASPIPERAAWRVHACPPTPADAARGRAPLTAPAWGEFLACTLRLMAPPQWVNTDPAAGATIRLAWGSPGVTPIYTVEEATRPDFADAQRIYEGPEQALTLYGRSAGVYYYRVRAQEAAGDPPAGNFSDWSAGLVVSIGPPAGLVVKPQRRTNPSQLTAAEIEQRGLLLQVQRALLRMCAARGDLLAVLALPEHYREDDAIAYVGLLAPSAQPVFDPDALLLDLPLGFGEMGALSYAAVYHPWLIELDAPSGAAAPRRTPPDGALCGLLASRALSRGAWVAPANQELTAVVALIPPLAPARWLDLQDAQINVIRQDPRGFLTLNADTLARDPDLVQINVRRLLQLLRRTAEQLGPGFVFEPVSDAFRRLVRRDVEAVLRVLLDRGAFAGASPETSYQVTVRASTQDLDAGRFIVEIRVAPSRPLEFLTVRLVQTGDRAVVTEER